VTHDEMIAVIQAHKEGEKIQYSIKGRNVWNDLTAGPLWDFHASDYRVKKEPKELWVVKTSHMTRFLYTKESAGIIASRYIGSTITHYREVVD
jgi:hypothetical protein